MKLHHDSAGLGRWTTETVADLEAAIERGLLICGEAIEKNRDITVLFEVRPDVVDRVMLTFQGQPDSEDYIGFRGCEELPVRVAKVQATTGVLDFSEPLGNYAA